MRREDWPDILAAYIKNAKPFEWGKNDCCLFSANFVKDITGIDYAEAFRGKYSTEKGAYLALKRHGKGSIVDTVSELLTEIPVPMCGRGDVAAYESDTGPALGICIGERTAFLGPGGVSSVLTADCIKAWRID